MGEGGRPVRNVNGEGVLGRVSVCVCVHSPRGGLGRSSYGEALSSDTTAAAAAAAVSRLLICTQTHTQKKKKINWTRTRTEDVFLLLG